MIIAVKAWGVNDDFRAIIPAMGSFIAVDIGGTQIRAAAYPAEGVTPLTSTRIPTRSTKTSTLDRLIELIRSIWPAEDNVSAIGVAAPGPVNHREGVIYSAPNIPGWTDLELSRILSERFGVSAYLGNDANLAAAGEWKYGAGQGHNDLIYFTVSTGIGGGVISGGRLLLGESGLAGEVGHVTIDPDGPICGCGKRGHWEALASGTALAAYVVSELGIGRSSTLGKESVPTGKEISRAARNGDALALEAFARIGRYLGLGMANYLHIFNPSIIILGGGVSQSLALFRQSMEDTLQEAVMSPQYLQRLTITTAALGDNAGLLGALVLARSTSL